MKLTVFFSTLKMEKIKRFFCKDQCHKGYIAGDSVIGLADCGKGRQSVIKFSANLVFITKRSSVCW